jgi:hypothetical protein
LPICDLRFPISRDWPLPFLQSAIGNWKSAILHAAWVMMGPVVVPSMVTLIAVIKGLAFVGLVLMVIIK